MRIHTYDDGHYGVYDSDENCLWVDTSYGNCVKFIRVAEGKAVMNLSYLYMIAQYRATFDAYKPVEVLANETFNEITDNTDLLSQRQLWDILRKLELEQVTIIAELRDYARDRAVRTEELLLMLDICNAKIMLYKYGIARQSSFIFNTSQAVKDSLFKYSLLYSAFSHSY